MRPCRGDRDAPLHEAADSQHVPHSLDILRTVISATPDAIFVKDLEGRYVLVNDAAAQFLGKGPDQIVGRHDLELYPEPTARAFMEADRAVLLAGEARTFENVATSSTGVSQVYLVTKGVYRDAEGTVRGVFGISHDITQRKRDEEAIRRSQEYRNLFLLANDPILILDPVTHTVLDVNDKACDVYGFCRDDFVGRQLREFVPESRGDEEQWARLTTDGTIAAFESVHVRADGTRAHVLCSPALIEYAGRPAVITINRDITERKQIADALTHACDLAVESARLKSEFLANVSHEIRTPMNGIIGMTELALDTGLTGYQRECLDTVKACAESLLTIVNDILDLSKIESRKLRLNRLAFSVREIVGQTLKPLTPNAAARGLELRADIAPDVPADVVGDPGRLQQILTNLLSNAIKFTERGHVGMTVTCTAHDTGSVVLHFRVRDTGIGIPPEKHATIFEAFCQADGSTTRRFGGTGLGLTICRMLVQLMDGEIWVESEPGHGSTFQFTARFGGAEVRNAVRSPGGKTTGETARDPVRPLRVLLAEDNVINQRVASGMLGRRGHEVTVVKNGREALAALERDRFDVVLMDVEMPELNGFEATAAIRARERTTGDHQRIIAMTAHAMGGDRDRCLAAGMDGYLAKPINRQQLLEMLEGPAGCAESDRPVLWAAH
jgi:PAS domain S-box-containing protein